MAACLHEACSLLSLLFMAFSGSPFSCLCSCPPNNSPASPCQNATKLGPISVGNSYRFADQNAELLPTWLLFSTRAPPRPPLLGSRMREGAGAYFCRAWHHRLARRSRLAALAALALLGPLRAKGAAAATVRLPQPRRDCGKAARWALGTPATAAKDGRAEWRWAEIIVDAFLTALPLLAPCPSMIVVIGCNSFECARDENQAPLRRRDCKLCLWRN